MAGNLSGRQARLALADARALEEQAERVNPVAPSRGRGKKLLGAVKGGGATPSMGLSQFRGGAAPLTDEAFAMMDMMPSGEYDGMGKHSLVDHLKHPTKGFGKMLGSKGHGVRRGGAETGAYQGEGRSGGGHIVGAGAGAGAGAAAEPVARAKRVIAEDDPRRRRAQLVGKVMKERGISLADASKVVKAEGMEY
jgi:hypothetical protein